MADDETTVAFAHADLARTVIAALMAALVTAVSVVIALALYTHVYKRLPWQSLPTQVTVCGRDYIYPDVDHPVSIGAASRYVGREIRPVGTTGGLFRARSIWGFYHRGQQAAEARCGSVVWVETNNGLIAYSPVWWPLIIPSASFEARP